MKTIVFFIIGILILSCEKEPLEVEILVHDTVYIDRLDTLLLTDTLLNVDSLFFKDTVVTIEKITDTLLLTDTIYIDGLPVIVYDTVYVDRIIRDTVYINENQSVFGVFHCYNWIQWRNEKLVAESGDEGWNFRITLDKYDQDLNGDGIFEYSYPISEFTDDYFITDNGTFYMSFEGESLILTKYNGDVTHKYYLK